MKNSKVHRIFLSNFKKLILDSEKPWLVKFTSDTCHLCQGLKPVFEKVATAFDGQVNFGNVNTRVERKLAEIFIEDGVPTLYYFDTDGTHFEVQWPDDPDPESGYSFLHLSSFLASAVDNE
jgi:thioredoxin 1